MDEYISRNALKRDLVDNRSFYPAIVAKAIENAPTVDVVPRVEVEKIIEASWKATQEVVKEIFEELEEMSEIHEYREVVTWDSILELKKEIHRRVEIWNKRF